MTEDPARARIIRRVARLAALAEHPRTPPAEAASAGRVARALIAEHRLTLADFGMPAPAPPAPVRRAAPPRPAPPVATGAWTNTNTVTTGRMRIDFGNGDVFEVTFG